MKEVLNSDMTKVSTDLYDWMCWKGRMSGSRPLVGACSAVGDREVPIPFIAWPLLLYRDPKLQTIKSDNYFRQKLRNKILLRTGQ